MERFDMNRMPPYRAGYCHCKMCQKGLGNLFGTAAFFKHAHFRFTQGTPTKFASATAKRGFCSNRGSPVCFQRKGFGTFPVRAFAEHLLIWAGQNPHKRSATPMLILFYVAAVF